MGSGQSAMGRCVAAFVCGVGALCGSLSAAPYPFPHPVVMEVLFNVPPGPAGDANLDGVRDATGDEFIELMNPHDRPINLAGYVLTDRHEPGSRQMRFEFPDVRLDPGAIVVVFNGHRSQIPGPVGDSAAAPTRGNEQFGGALVFDMRITSRGHALANAADALILWSPAGEPVEAVVWGSPDPAPPQNTPRISEVPHRVRGSVQRLTPGGEFLPHEDIEGALFSPGVIPRPAAGGADDATLGRRETSPESPRQAPARPQE